MLKYQKMKGVSIMAKGQIYDEEFKKTIVDLYNSKKPACEITREYGISNSVLYKWVKQYSPIKMEDGTITTNKELQKLKKELFKVKEENEILKKAIVIFTQKQKIKLNLLMKTKINMMYEHYVKY